MILINDLRRKFGKRPDLISVLEKVISSGTLIHGEEHRAFEDELASFIGVNYALGVANGTDAIELALRAVGCVAGSKVITVANAGGYTSLAAMTIGCELIYCDVNPKTLVMDIDSLKACISKDVKAVVVTHLFGNVAPIKEIYELCKILGIKVIEDCAQAIGASCDGIQVGAFGDLGTFSFYPTKNLGGIGDGGAVATNNDLLYNRVKSLRQYGWDTKYSVKFHGGMNSRLDEIQAAILRIELSALPGNNQMRRKIVSKYVDATVNSDLELITGFSSESAPHLAVLTVPSDTQRNGFREYLKNLGIQSEIHYPVLDFNQEGMSQKLNNFQVSISSSVIDKIVTIPLFPELTEDEINQICKALKEFPRFKPAGFD